MRADRSELAVASFLPEGYLSSEGLGKVILSDLCAFFQNIDSRRQAMCGVVVRFENPREFFSGIYLNFVARMFGFYLWYVPCWFYKLLPCWFYKFVFVVFTVHRT